jgi:hypothetical protein
MSSAASSSRYGPVAPRKDSALRKEVLRSPDEAKKNQHMDLFPFTKARLSDVPFRPTDLGPERTPDDLRLNMLKVVFGWDNDIDELVQDECKLTSSFCSGNLTNFHSGTSHPRIGSRCTSLQMAR